MRRLYTIIIASVMIILMIAGGIVRSTYECLEDKEDILSGELAAQLPSELLERQINLLKESIIDESSYILAVECVEGMHTYYGCATQKCKVVSVFKGEGLSEGDEIEIGKIYHMSFPNINTEEKIAPSDYYISFNIGFTNSIQTGQKYLVFLDHKLLHSENIYVDAGYIFSHIYGYFEQENSVTELIDKESEMDTLYVLYDDVSDNEYFLMEESENEMIKDIKEYLFERFSIEN